MRRLQLLIEYKLVFSRVGASGDAFQGTCITSPEAYCTAVALPLSPRTLHLTIVIQWHVFALDPLLHPA